MEHSAKSHAKGAPSFQSQKHVDDTLHAMLRQSLRHATGVEPTASELELAVRREFSELACGFRGKRVLEPWAQHPLHSTGMASAPAEDVELAVRYASAHGVQSVLEAVRTFVVHHAQARRAPKLAECVAEFLATKRAESRSPSTLNGYTSKLTRFAAHFADRGPGEIEANEIGAFLRCAEHPKTRLDWWNTLLTFYKWCVAVKYAAENPVPLAMRRPVNTPGARLVLTPDETKAILSAVRRTDQLTFWCLALFAGLRSAEIRRLAAEPNPWDVVRLSSHVIDLPDHITKTGPRLVPINPTLRDWLELAREADGCFFPPNHALKLRRLREFVLSPRTQVLDDAHRVRNVDYRPPIWGYNIARRSYISYRLVSGASYATVADEVGNTEAILRSNYAQRAAASDAELYFGLTPSVCDGR